MKRWGLVLSGVYVLLIVLLLAPAARLLQGEDLRTLADLRQAYQETGVRIIVAVLLIGEFSLLALGIDSSRRRLTPRASVVVSALITGFLTSILIFAACLALILTFPSGTQWTDETSDTAATIVEISGLLLPWLVWSILFYRLYRNADDPVTHAVSWMLRGSVLELLIVVPCHVVVRRRHECCAPAVTGLGIATGLAIMFLSFGPSVVLLFKKRLDRKSVPEAVAR
jgi:hypothetical protein